MSTFQRQYKVRKFGFGNAKEGRFLRAEKREESRKSQRAQTFNANRNISVPSPESKGVPVIKDRLTRLMKWKAEREKHKKLEQMKKKPPFVVGVVRHKIYSPISKQTIPQHVTRRTVRNKTAAASPPKRVTRATEKRLTNKALAKKETKHPKSVNKKQRKQESFAPADYKFKPPAGLPHIPLFGRVALQSISPARISGFMSPFVKISEMKVPRINVLNRNINTPSSVRSLRRQNAVDESDKDLMLNVTLTRLEDIIEHTDLNASRKKRSPKRVSMYNKKASGYDESIRVLRNRIVTSGDSPKTSKSPSKISINVPESEHTKDKTTSMTTRRRSSAKITIEDKRKKSLQNSLNKTGGKRRSHRNVKFFEKVNSDSVLNKSTLPMTPHIRQSRAKSNEKNKSLTADLISWETPEKPPDRVRKSRSKRIESLI